MVEINWRFGDHGTTPIFWSGLIESEPSWFRAFRSAVIAEAFGDHGQFVALDDRIYRDVVFSG
jgi:hypothetical protein